MNWYISVIRDNFANFQGRARRSEFWYFVLFNLIITAILFGIAMLTGLGFILYGLYSLVVLIPNIAVTVRRLHDIGKSGWWYFIGFVPIIGGIWLLVLLCTEGNQGPNEYGPDPKNPYQDLNEIGAKTQY